MHSYNFTSSKFFLQYSHSSVDSQNSKSYTTCRRQARLRGNLCEKCSTCYIDRLVFVGTYIIIIANSDNLSTHIIISCVSACFCVCVSRHSRYVPVRVCVCAVCVCCSIFAAHTYILLRLFIGERKTVGSLAYACAYIMYILYGNVACLTVG